MKSNSLSKLLMTVALLLLVVSLYFQPRFKADRVLAENQIVSLKKQQVSEKDHFVKVMQALEGSGIKNHNVGNLRDTQIKMLYRVNELADQYDVLISTFSLVGKNLSSDFQPHPLYPDIQTLNGKMLLSVRDYEKGKEFLARVRAEFPLAFTKMRVNYPNIDIDMTLYGTAS